MQISVEKVSSLGRKINILIPASNINDLVSGKLQKLTKEVKLNGFRPGHVPFKLIRQKYGISIRQEAINEAIDLALNQAMSENKLFPLGDIKLENIVDDEASGKDLQCEFFLEVYPEIDFKDFTGLEIKTPKVNITEKDIDNGILILRENMGEKVVVDRPAISGDILTIDFSGLIDGKEFPGSVGIDTQVEIGSCLFIDGFESGLIGTSVGISKELTLRFPDDYAEQSLSGKSVVFNVSIKKIEEKKLAEVDEKLANHLKIEGGAVTQIRAKVLANMESHVKKLTIEREKEQLIELLLHNYPVDLPERLVKEEEQQLQEVFKQHNKEQGVIIKDLNKSIKDEILAKAIKKVHLSLLLREIIKKYELKVEENLLQQQLRELDNLFGDMKNNARYQKIYNNMQNSVINSSLTELAINFVMSKVIKSEELLSFDQLNNTK